jgi:cytochrome oxidase Cu insertion factor (SCO1/SenC/PrrC family)
MKRAFCGVFLAVSLLAAAAFAAAAPDYAGMQIQPYDPPKPTPQFAFPDLSGKTVTLEEIKGKVTMLIFWATW